MTADATEQPSAESPPDTISVPVTAEGALIGQIRDAPTEWAQIGTAVGTMLAGHPLGTAMTSIAALARALDETEGHIEPGAGETVSILGSEADGA